MLDIKFIRENPELVRRGIENKNEKNKIDELLELDKQRRDIITKSEELKAKKNQVSQEVARLKKTGQDASKIIEEMKSVSNLIKEFDDKLSKTESELEKILMYIPNLPHKSVPVGKSSADNV
jgi:seryl-tRNA synthetase